MIRKGSRGEDVKRLQMLLGIEADGVFGQQTHDAVVAFQQAHGLTPDGIVGNLTWAALEGQETVDIISGYIYTHITKSPNRPIQYIAIHYTAGSTSKKGSALNTRNVFLSRRASADFVVDDAEIVQINPDLKNNYCWSVGDKKNIYSGGGRLYGKATNKNTVSIEICSNLKGGASAQYANHYGWYFTEAALNNAVKLVRYLMKKYGVPKENVVRHYDVSGKLCPGVVGWNNATIYSNDGKATATQNNSRAWQNFLDMI